MCNFFRSLIIKNNKDERSKSKNVLPCAPMIGVQPSINVSANMVPDINQGNPVNKIDLKYSTTIQTNGNEKIMLNFELNLK